MRDLAAELMKIRTRWLPYVVLLALIVGAAAQVLLFGVVAYHDSDQGVDGNPGLRSFAMPWALHTMLDSGQFWGAILIAFVIASMVATEYGWGTVRLAIARGQSRTRYLATKLLGATITATALLLITLAIAVAMALIASWFEGEPITLDVRGGPSPAEVPVMVGRAALGILPYGMLAFCLAIIGRSTTLGATGLLVYKLGESILLPLFENLGGFWADLRVLFLGHYAEALIAANRIDEQEYASLAFRSQPVAAELPDPWLAAAMLLLWTALLAAVAFAVFSARDLNARVD
jgi:ABC-type transport system involved in multi-copper enzyme maturation permease subunit